MNFNFFSQKMSLFLLIVIIFITACSKDEHDHPELQTGEDFFNAHCAGCHKPDGTGLFLKGIPANISTNKNISELILYIKQGGQSNHSKMPVFKTMPDAEASKIARHLLVLKNRYIDNKDNKNKLLLKRKDKL